MTGRRLGTPAVDPKAPSVQHANATQVISQRSGTRAATGTRQAGAPVRLMVRSP
jgi:hypothetical protein